MKTTVLDFANDLRVMEKCDHILVTSKVEAGLINGFGLRAHYYPYIPVGSVKERLLLIRDKRRYKTHSTGLFLLLGTAKHGTTRDSMLWLIDQVERFGLPDGVKIIAAGGYTDNLVGEGKWIPGFDFRGWLPQDEFDQLLISADGVLIPQYSGFGALVRLPELACAGVPVIVDLHPTYARGKTPGMYVVKKDWAAWCQAMAEIRSGAIKVTDQEYNTWEKQQPNPLKPLLEHYLSNVY